MAESLEEFLQGHKSSKIIKVSGAMACQQCNEIVNDGDLDEDTMILVYHCSKWHESKVKL
jgi:hypothetical protein